MPGSSRKEGPMHKSITLVDYPKDGKTVTVNVSDFLKSYEHESEKSKAVMKGFLEDAIEYYAERMRFEDALYSLAERGLIEVKIIPPGYILDSEISRKRRADYTAYREATQRMNWLMKRIEEL